MKKSSGKNDTGSFVSAPDMAYLCSRSLETETWHMFGLCLSLLCGLIFEPFSEPVISLIVLGLGACFVEKPAVLYSGYAAPGSFGFCLQCFLPAGRLRKPD